MRTRPRLAPRIVTRELRTYRIQVFEWVTVIDIACVVSFDELLRLAFKCAYAWRLCLRCACGLALQILACVMQILLLWAVAPAKCRASGRRRSRASFRISGRFGLL